MRSATKVLTEISEKDKLRFLKKINQGSPEECWLWTGHKVRGGYGHFRIGGAYHGSHRIAFFIATGSLSKLHILHSCDNPACCNPAHLRQGTDLENVRDRDKRGRRASTKGESHPIAKLSNIKIQEIKRMWRSGNFYQREIAAWFDITQGHVNNILRGRQWAHVL